MALKQRGRRAAKERTVRASVTLSKDVYETLGLIAGQKKVSVAWVIRDAAERYVTDQWPLLAPPQ
jgi:hypothetical protein